MHSLAGMRDGWREETARVAASFDRIADLYRAKFTDELDRKPFDRDLLDRIAGRLRYGLPALEVGAGPACVAGYLAAGGTSVFASDASLGQLREARVIDADRPLVAADLARLPVRPRSLGGIVAFYCLIYGPPDHLDDVFADWHRALVPGGLVLIAVHTGDGTIRSSEWEGRTVDITVVLRDPDDLVTRLERTGFSIGQRVVRTPYEDEFPTERCYVVAEAKP